MPASSIETIRRILHERGVSWQATKTWRAGTGPDFTSEMRRILGLYDHPPTDGLVICVDEFGALNLQPRPGRAWRPQGQPARLRATYTRDQGVRHMIAALDHPMAQPTSPTENWTRHRLQDPISGLPVQGWITGH
ncbi:hypothetical protein ACWDV4_27670 [Micromonospora sp. NPDC003197]